MQKNNDFWISSLLYLEDEKIKYTEEIEEKVKRMILLMFNKQSKSIKMIRSRFKPKISFLLKDELSLISEAFNIDFKRSEWIFILQETQQRILSMIKMDELKQSLNIKLTDCINEGEKINTFLREQLQALQDDHEIKYRADAQLAQTRGDFKLVGRLLKQAHEIQEYTEITDEASDHILDLFLTCH